MDRLEKGSGQQVITLKEARLLLREDDDLIVAVYDYWLNKRLRLVSGRWAGPGRGVPLPCATLLVNVDFINGQFVITHLVFGRRRFERAPSFVVNTSKRTLDITYRRCKALLAHFPNVQHYTSRSRLESYALQFHVYFTTLCTHTYGYTGSNGVLT